MRLLNYLKYLLCKKIDREIKDDELYILKCIIYPNDFKSNNIQKSILFPPKGRNNISLIRLKYCNSNFVKEFGLQLAQKRGIGQARSEPSKFWGIVFINNKLLQQNNIQLQISNSEHRIIGSPMIDNENYYPKDTIVYKCDKGNTAHADLEYFISTPNDSEPQKLQLRKYTDNLFEIIKNGNYFIQDSSEVQHWTGKRITDFKFN